MRSPESPEKWEAGVNERRSECLPASFVLLVRFLSNAVCVYNQQRWHIAVHTAVLWSRSPACFIAPHISTYICQDNVTSRNKMFCQALLNLFSQRKRVKLNYISAVHNGSVFCMILFFRPLEKSARRNPGTRKKEIKILSSSQPTNPKIAKIKTREEKSSISEALAFGTI